MSQPRTVPRPRSGTSSDENPPAASADHPLHRLAEVRRQEGVSLRRVARLLRTNMKEVQRQEDAASDLRLSTLYQWQEALEVPVANLLIDEGAPLSPSVEQRARLVRLMKTALSILERSEKSSVRRLAQTMIGQLTEIMPELDGISAWHAVGKRRTLDEFGRVVERCFPDQVMVEN